MKILAIVIFMFSSFVLGRSYQPRNGCDSAVLESGSSSIAPTPGYQGEKHHRPSMVAYEIAEDGTVSKVRLVRSSGIKDLDQRLLGAVSQWKYHVRPGCGVMKVPLAAATIPDAATAIKVAEPEMIRIYGASVIKSERPITATLSNDLWIVGGTLQCSDGKGGITTVCVGGVATVHLAKSDGRILKVFHTQ